MAKLAIAPPTVHSMVRGNIVKDKSKQDKKGLTGKVLFADRVPQLIWLKTSELIPLDTQRETNSKWVVERQESQGGLNMLAFGVLSVAHDPEDGNYYVWDGCGRWAIADFNGGIDTVPCIVYSMTKSEAAYYFAYNQEEGRRKLSREVTFVNGVIGGDEEHLEWARRLDQIGAYIKANDNDQGIVNPDARNKGYPEMHARALMDGFKLAGEDLSIQQQARNMIVYAWGTADEGCPKIITELYWALIVVLKCIPESRKNGLNSAMQKYLNWLAEGKTQSQASKEWKDKDLKGISGQVGVAKILGYNFAKSFMAHSSFKQSFRNDFTLEKIYPKKNKVELTTE